MTEAEFYKSAFNLSIMAPQRAPRDVKILFTMNYFNMWNNLPLIFSTAERNLLCTSSLPPKFLFKKSGPKIKMNEQ